MPERARAGGDPVSVTGMLAGRHVGLIGFGTRQLPACDRERAVKVVRRAVALDPDAFEPFLGDVPPLGNANEALRREFSAPESNDRRYPSNDSRRS